MRGVRADRVGPLVGPLAVDISEKAFTTTVIDLATRMGWLVNHQRPAMVRVDGDKPRYVTATQGHVGFPDLILVHGPWELALARELKVGSGRPTSEQKQWGEGMLRAGLSWAIWRPEDWLTEIAPTLLGQRRERAA
jgi:hypothetical protein